MRKLFRWRLVAVDKTLEREDWQIRVGASFFVYPGGVEVLQIDLLAWTFFFHQKDHRDACRAVDRQVAEIYESEVF